MFYCTLLYVISWQLTLAKLLCTVSCLILTTIIYLAHSIYIVYVYVYVKHCWTLFEYYTNSVQQCFRIIPRGWLMGERVLSLNLKTKQIIVTGMP
jgi:hypothetical protein